MGYRSSDFLILTSLRVVAPSPSPAVPLSPSRPNRGEGGNVLLAVRGSEQEQGTIQAREELQACFNGPS